MSKFVITTSTPPDYCTTELTSLTYNTDIRGSQDGGYQFRKYLRVSTITKYKSITHVKTPEPTLDHYNEVDFAISGGDLMTIDPDWTVGVDEFLLVSQDLSPYQEQGVSTNILSESWVAEGTEWKDVDFTHVTVAPELKVWADPASTTYDYLDALQYEVVSTWNETRTYDGVAEYVPRLKVVNYFDAYDVKNIIGFTNTLSKLPMITPGVSPLPLFGYNDDTSVGLEIPSSTYVNPIFNTGFEVIPIGPFGGKMARVKYTYEIIEDWLPQPSWIISP